jgi:hypothetical protein
MYAQDAASTDCLLPSVLTKGCIGCPHQALPCLSSTCLQLAASSPCTWLNHVSSLFWWPQAAYLGVGAGWLRGLRSSRNHGASGSNLQGWQGAAYAGHVYTFRLPHGQAQQSCQLLDGGDQPRYAGDACMTTSCMLTDGDTNQRPAEVCSLAIRTHSSNPAYSIDAEVLLSGPQTCMHILTDTNPRPAWVLIPRGNEKSLSATVVCLVWLGRCQSGQAALASLSVSVQSQQQDQMSHKQTRSGRGTTC